MRTPYPELQIDTTSLAAEFAAWNAANQRAMDEYALCPSAVYAQFNLSAAERMRLVRATKRARGSVPR